MTDRWTALPCNMLCRITAEGLQTETVGPGRAAALQAAE
jgi:glutamine amidotransferase